MVEGASCVGSVGKWLVGGGNVSGASWGWLFGSWSCWARPASAGACKPNHLARLAPGRGRGGGGGLVGAGSLKDFACGATRRARTGLSVLHLGWATVPRLESDGGVIGEEGGGPE